MEDGDECIIRRLWKHHRWENIEQAEETEESNDPVRVFGILKASRKRSFSNRRCLVLDIRPFELWDRELEGSDGFPLVFFDESENALLSILMECDGGDRIMGLISRRGFERFGKEVKVGGFCKVSGVFNYVKPLWSRGVFMFFRITELS